jgi:hypothetical protein
VVLADPSNQVGYWGKSASFSVKITGIGPFTYQWLHDGVSIPNATNAVLTLTDLAITDAGNYSVIVANSFGSVTSGSAMLTVNPAGVSLNMYAGVAIDGVVGRTYRIEYVTDLQQTNTWTTLANVTLTSSIQVWIDMDSAGQPKRFYRVTIP